MMSRRPVLMAVPRLNKELNAVYSMERRCYKLQIHEVNHYCSIAFNFTNCKMIATSFSIAHVSFSLRDTWRSK